MASDARFEEAGPADRPLRLRAEGPEDLKVVSALLQDAVGKIGEISWARGRRRLVMLLNRFRWENRSSPGAEGRPPERVRAMLTIDTVETVRARGLAPGEADTVVALLALEAEGSADPDDPAATLYLRFAGDGDIAARVEAIDVTLEDVTRPWLSPSAKTPAHGD